MARKNFTKDDKVWRQIKKNLRAAKSQINLGWFEGQAYGSENNFLPMAQVAQWVEEGHRGGWGPTPARPAIRTLFIPVLAESGELTKFAIPMIHEVAMGRMTWKKLHERLAPKILYRFKLALEQYSAIPNSPVTVKLKGFNNPLVETGALIANARFKVDDYKPATYRMSFRL